MVTVVAEALGHEAAVFDADFFGHGLGLLAGKEIECTAEQGDQHVVMTHWKVEVIAHGGCRVALRGSTGSAAGSGNFHPQVPTGSEFVEVMSGHVGMKFECPGDLGGGDSLVGVTGQQIDLASGGIAESRGDRGDDRGELRRREAGLVHRSILPMAIGEIPPPPERAPMSVTEHDVIEVLRPVEDPELHRSIVDLGMVRGVAIDGAVVAVRIALTVAGCPLRNEIQTRVSDAVVALDGIDRVELDFTVMTDEERAAVREMLIGDPASTAGSNPTHGHSEGRTIPFADPMSRTRVLLIASGKGGVGKSSVSANLAIALAQRGKKVAIVDADVWGFSIPRMLGVEHTPVVIDDMLVPPQTHGVSCISMGFFVEEDQPVMWRGPMLHKALEQFLTDVFWDEPDYLVVDLPPGTGDVALSISGYLPRSEMYVVTTPQEAAQKVAQRAAYMAKKVQIDVKGIIENMSWFTGDDGKRYQVFGEGGGARLAEELEVPLIGQIPISISLRSGSDTGDPIMAADPDSEAAAAIRAMAERIDVEFAPTRRPNRGLKLLG